VAEHSLENDLCAVTVTDRGRITSLRNKVTGTELVSFRPSAGWKAITTLGCWGEHPVTDGENRGRLEPGPGKIEVVFDELCGAAGARLPIRLALRYELAEESDEIACSYVVENRSEEIVKEVWFPFLSGLGRVGGDEAGYLALPRLTGRRVAGPGVNLPSDFVPYHDGVREGYGIEYPGYGSMGWMEFYGESEGLHLGSHDPSFARMTHLARREERGAFRMGFATYPFAAPGDTYTSPRFVVSPHVGDWRVGARKYRARMRGPAVGIERPSWLAGAPGVRLVFMKHQTGRVYLRYPDLVGVWHELREAGLADVPMLVFAWFRGGHDSGYPLLEPDPEMGGREGLAAALGAIRGDGGRVVLYANGVLIDRSGAYFKTGGGREAAMKNPDGCPYTAEYSYREEGTVYPGKTFAVACPGAAGWEAELERMMDDAMALGASGILYDQLGGYTAHLCFDPSHGHDGPARAVSAKLDLLRRLRARASARDPDFGVMSEIAVDAFGGFFDLVHAAPYRGGASGERFLEMYRYAFPEQPLTSRAAWEPDTTGYAFVMGLAPEYAGASGPTLGLLERKQGHGIGPDLVDRVERMMRLRSLLRPYLACGRFVNTDGLRASPASVVVKAFRAREGEGLALAAWNPGAGAVRVSVDTGRTRPEWRLYRLDGDPVEGSTPVGAPVEFDLGGGEVAVATVC
jgi:hypothetical protein